MPTPGKSLSLVCKPSEFSLYFHFPFCKRICPYCHFYVQKAPSERENWQEHFIQQLLADWNYHKSRFQHKKLSSLYLGGGTPSLFSAKHLKPVLETVLSDFNHPQSIEITLEANPESITQEAIEDYKRIGINRLSLGVQSLEDSELLRLGRGHQHSKAEHAIELVKQHFENYSLDLMMETPGQTLDSWQRTLDKIALINPPHLSLYNLVIEPGTAYAKIEKRLRKEMADVETATLMLTRACQSFELAGLKRYEISAFARPGFESVHNSGYWRGREFLGLGPSAFSFFDSKRLQKHSNLEKWQQAVEKHHPGWELIDDPSEAVRQAELLAVHLRLLCGVDLESFQNRWGPLNQELSISLKALIEMGWLKQEGAHLSTTDEGRLFYDRLASELMPV